jgi:hypothetical protein
MRFVFLRNIMPKVIERNKYVRIKHSNVSKQARLKRKKMRVPFIYAYLFFNFFLKISLSLL